MSCRGAVRNVCLCLATRNQSETRGEVTDGCGLKDIIISAGSLREEKHFPVFSTHFLSLHLTKAQSHKVICMRYHESNITLYIGTEEQVAFTLPLVVLLFIFIFFDRPSLFTCTSNCLSLTLVQPLNVGDVMGIQQWDENRFRKVSDQWNSFHVSDLWMKLCKCQASFRALLWICGGTYQLGFIATDSIRNADTCSIQYLWHFHICRLNPSIRGYISQVMKCSFGLNA